MQHFGCPTPLRLQSWPFSAQSFWPAALSGSASAKLGAAFPGWLQLKVIKTTNSAKARNDVVDIVYFLLWAQSKLFIGGSRNFFATYFVSYPQIDETTKKKKSII